MDTQNSQKYDVEGIEYELVLSRNTGLNMVKQVFYDVDLRTVATNYLCFDNPGFARENAKKMLCLLFKNIDDFYLLDNDAITSENAYLLLAEHPHLFKSVKSVTVVENGKYKNVKAMEFGE